MNTWQTLLVVLGAIVVAALMIRFVLPRLDARGVDVPAVVESAKSVVATANNIVNVLRPFLAEVTGIDVVDKILATAHVGVGNAEQLYLVGQLEPGERKNAARQYIRDTLTLIGVEITPEVERVIDGAIEAEVLSMGHKKITMK